jgi:hypothetical protein
LGSRRHPTHWSSSKGKTYQRGVLGISGGSIEGHFEGKTSREYNQGRLVFTKIPQLTALLQPNRNWPT